MISDSSSPRAGPRAMAEQSILKILWPPDGRPAWEDRHKIPRIEQALGRLLDIVENDDVQITSIKARESQKLTAQILDLRRQGLTMAQIAEVTGLTEYAVIHRISNSKKMQTANSVDTGSVQERANPPGSAPQDVKSAKDEPFSCHHENGQGEPAALRSAAPDQIVEANKMIADTDQPKVEQVARPATALQGGQGQPANPTVRKDRIVEETAEVRPAKVPLTEDQKAKILELKESGLKPKEIANQLGIPDARKVQGIILQEMRRTKMAENVPAVQSSDIPVKPAKDVMLLQQPANVVDTSDTSSAAPKPADEKPAPKAVSRAETDKKMWDLWKSGKSPKEIVDILWDENLYYSEKSVTVRLRSQGADL